MPRQLTISSSTSTTPFRSSFLAIPPTPFSPRLPINPPATAASPPKTLAWVSTRTARVHATVGVHPPPPEPLHWLWQCHKCNRVYQLSVTRRCLDDGHFFCAGVTTVKRTARRHQACASEFDYSGWKAWGTWRREVLRRVEEGERAEEEENTALGLESGGEEADGWVRMKREVERARSYWERCGVVEHSKGGRKYNNSKKKDCWANCDYPSECRWGKQFGVKTPVLPRMQIEPGASTAPEKDPGVSCEDITHLNTKPRCTFEEILLDMTNPQSPDSLSPLSPLESERSPSNSPGPEVRDVMEGETHVPSVEQLVKSAKRREQQKRKSQSGLPLVPSPLAAHPPSPEDESGPEADSEQKPSALQKAADDFERDIKQKDDTLVQRLRLAGAKFQLRAAAAAAFSVPCIQ